MSLKAGGVGLNLTAASNVFLMVIDLCIVNPMTCKYLFLHQLANLNGHINFFFFCIHIGSMVESCSGRTSYHANSPYRAKESGPSKALHCQGKDIDNPSHNICSLLPESTAKIKTHSVWIPGYGRGADAEGASVQAEDDLWGADRR